MVGSRHCCCHHDARVWDDCILWIISPSISALHVSSDAVKWPLQGRATRLATHVPAEAGVSPEMTDRFLFYKSSELVRAYSCRHC